MGHNAQIRGYGLRRLTPAEQRADEHKFVGYLAIATALVALIPTVVALVSGVIGSRYIGMSYNTDDHMVYAAWMRQAMDGHLLFDNRFTTDAQPGLTVHVLFLVMGWVAKLLSIPITMTLFRVGASVGFVYLLASILRRTSANTYQFKLGLSLTVLSGGLGFLLWHDFGQSIVLPAPDALKSFMLDRLPVDVWQPEGFVFPSFLTNALFMVSLCLILGIFRCVLRVKDDPKQMWIGAGLSALLMNIHSYDMLLVSLVLIAFVAALAQKKQLTKQWILRAVAIGCGAIIPAIWFLYVLKSDAVFQARAATETFTPNFRQILLAYLPLICLALGGLVVKAHNNKTESAKLMYIGIGIYAALILVLTVAAGSHTTGYFFEAPVWVILFAVTIVCSYLVADENPTVSLITAWALVSLIAPYFPGLFQRKLMMGASIPWSILAGYGLNWLLRKQERTGRNLATTLVLLVLGGTSLRWLLREVVVYTPSNVSNTTRHPVFLSTEMQRILKSLDAEPGKRVLLALPGAANPKLDEQNNPVPDRFDTPILPDLAPIITGYTGTYSYAGHWSETPEYGKKCGDMYRFFLLRPFGSIKKVMSDEERAEFIAKTGATHALVPNADTVNLPLVDPTKLGTVLLNGGHFSLVRLNASK